MCMSSPNIPPPPPPPQEVKQPDSANLANNARRNRAAGMAAPSLLTGPSGAMGAPTGRTTLLGQ